jgi:hypothetical protein
LFYKLNRSLQAYDGNQAASNLLAHFTQGLRLLETKNMVQKISGEIHAS